MHRSRLLTPVILAAVLGIALDQPTSAQTTPDFFLRGAGADANPPTIFLDTTAPTATTAKYKDSTSINFSGGNPWKEVGTWPADQTLTSGTLSALTDLHVWLGLKNSDDQGTNFDLLAELYKNGVLVTSGLTRCITGVTRNPDLAKEATATFASFSAVTFNGTTDQLSLKVWTRIGTNPDNTKCAGHSNAVGLRLYFDATSRPARFGATISVATSGPLTQARVGHTATLLPSGKVLLAGGTGPAGVLNSAELFDPVALSATALTNSLTTARTEHTATLLPQTETLLIAGQDSLGLLFSTEMFNPSSQTFRALSPNVQVLRSGHTATLLLDGRVLITGGQSSGALGSAEAFNAQTVVVFKPAYDPEAGTFTVLPNSLITPRWDHTATVLADGRILLTGGQNQTGVLASAEIFDPATETFTALASTLTTPRAGHTATLLPDGRVLILGGQTAAGAVASAEVFSPSTNSFSTLSPGLMAARVNHTATLLPTGLVLIAGGQNSSGILSSTELYTPSPADTMAPVVNHVTPPGDATGVDLTEIIGVRFSEPVDVRTLTSTNVTLSNGGAVAATLSPGEQGLMLFVVPSAPLAAGTTYTLSLTANIKDTSGHPLSAFTSQFTTVAAPTITGFTPASGPVGTAVTMTGTNFDPVASQNEVKFNGVLATVTAASATSLTAPVPGGATTGPITVTTRGGTATSATNFTVITQPPPTITGFSPSSGRVGDQITISGTNFINVSSVAFNGVPATTFSVTSATSILATVPTNATTGPITVTNSFGTGVSTGSFVVIATQDFQLSVLPGVAGVPAVGSAAFSVGLTGSGGFTNLTTLTVAGVPTGATAAFAAATLTAGQSTFLTLTTNGATLAGSYPLTVTASGLVNEVQTARSATVMVQVLGAGVTTLAGQVRDEDDKPVKGALVKLGSLQAPTAQTTTDDGGNFLLQNAPAGANQLLFIDGGPASTPEKSLPIIPYKVTIVAGQNNTLGFTPHLHFQKTTGLVDISNSSVERIVTDPTVPGFKMTIPAGVTITGWDGQPNTQVSVREVPLDRNPLPALPEGGVVGAIYMDYFNKPGGGTPSQPIPITFPNNLNAPPGTPVELWYYDEAPDGSRPNQWAMYGTGTVSADGMQVVPNIDPSTGKPYGQPRFCCGSAWFRILFGVYFSLVEGSAPSPGGAKGGEPVDLATGLFVLEKTDLVLPGRLPVTFTRSYRTNSTYAGPFGTGTNHSYGVRLVVQNFYSNNTKTLVFPDGVRLNFAPQPDGTFRNFTDPAYRGAVLTQTGSVHTLRLKDGMTWTFGAPVQPNVASLASVSDRYGNTITLTRSGFQDRLDAITDSAGRQITLSYDARDRIVQLTDPLARTVSYAYDGNGNLATVTDPQGGVTRYTYDAQRRMLTIVDPRGITFLTNQYDSNGRVIQQTQADGGVWQFAYTVTGGVITQTVVTDPNGKHTTNRFNGRGYPLVQTDDQGQATTSARDPATNQVTSTSDALGRKTTFTYDANGNTTSITDPAGSVTDFEYEPTFNRVTKITQRPNATTTLVTTFTYDPANGNLLTTTNPKGETTTIAYNQFGQPTSVQGPIPSEPPTTFAYDTNGNLITTTDPLGNATQRAYDAVSRLTALTDPRGSVTQFLYDGLNRVANIADARHALTGFGYDPNGNLLGVTDAKNQATGYTYDSMDRLAARTDALNRQERYQYDPAGNLTQFTDRKNQTATFTYDSLNRRTAASYADGSSTSFTYDSVGRLAAVTDSISGTIQYSYDNLDRFIQEVMPQSSVQYAYDALGRRTSMTVSGQQPVTYQYDAASRLTQVAQGSLVVTIGYDDAGRRTSLTYPNGTSTSYSYDFASRLTSITHNGPSGLIESVTYTYDTAGNRLTANRAVGAATTVPNATTASYDAANELTAIASGATQSLTYDANGNLTSDGANTYTWDARNRLIAISGAVSASFTYDALGRRVSKTVNGVTTQLIYDGNDIVQESGSSGVASYLRSLNIDEPFVRQSSTSEYYHTDALGSVLALTGQNGAVQTTYNYEAFGKTTITGTSSNPFQFTGRENDGTGLYYYRYRYYSSFLQRFLGEDPLGLLAGLNAYRYVLNNPLIYFDPLGLHVTVTLYAGQNGNVFNHIGVGVNSPTTYGLTTDSPLAPLGLTVPGYVAPNTTPVLETITIPTSPQEDAIMQAIISNALGSKRQSYNLFTNNCVTFAISVLKAGGIKVPNTIFPNGLMSYLQQAYGQQPQQNPLGGVLVPSPPVI